MDALTGSDFSQFAALSGAIDGVAGSEASVVTTVLGIVALIFGVSVITIIVIALCRIFKKAGYHRYEALLNGHNMYVSIVLAGKPGWYTFLFAVPYVIFALVTALFPNTTFVSVVSIIMLVAYVYLYADVMLSLAKRFKKGV